MEISLLLEGAVTVYFAAELWNISRVLGEYIEYEVNPLVGRHYGIRSSLEVGKNKINNLKYLTPIARIMKNVATESIDSLLA
ncbi:MAG: hypothetical protein J7K73_03055 [Nanoarchaeota archaeon]|nr:hypothetical protein [Nanoarchaeota archaeon]